jgi:phytoene synthase
VDELASAFFWVGRLMTLKDDLARDWLFFPLSDLRLAEVSVEDLRSGEITEGVRRLLWKQTIRAKDAFAQSEQLVIDLPRPYASAVKRWWIGGLEILNEIVRRDYDVWTEPVSLSTFYRLQVRLQARFGRTTFRSR